VLPTFRSARFASALGVDDFLRRVHVVWTDAAGLASMTLRGPVPIGTGTSAGPVSGWPRVLLTTSLGDILVTLSPRDAPQHVKLLQSLVGAGSYNGAYVGRADPAAYVQVFSSASEQAVTPLPLVSLAAPLLARRWLDRERGPFDVCVARLAG